MVTHYDNHQQPDGFNWLETPLAFEHGVQLTGWKVRYVGPRLRVSTLWQVTDKLSAAETIQQFHHLYAAGTTDGPPLAISDVGLSISTWRRHDRVIVMADFFPEDDGLYQIAVGHYRLRDGSRLWLENGADRVVLPVFNSADLPHQP
jgi:hypothetical protein